MNNLVERARRTVRNYPEHVAKREQAKLILELADEIERLGKAFEAAEEWCESHKQWDTLVRIENLRKNPSYYSIPAANLEPIASAATTSTNETKKP